MAEIANLRYLLAVAEQGHFGRAAEVLGVTQPAVTMGLRQLEKRYGVELIERGRGRAVKPTVYGRALMARAARIVREQEAIESEIAQLSGSVEGHVRIGTGPILAARVVPDAVARVVEEHPAVTTEIVQGQWRDLTASLEEGDLDLFVGDISGAGNDARMEVAPFREEEVLWAVRKGHPLAGKKRVRRDEMLSYPFVGPTLPPWAEEWFQEEMAETGAGRDFRGRVHAVESNDYTTILRIVLRTDAVTGATRGIVDGTAGKLVTLALAAPVIMTRTGVVFVRDREQLPAMRRVCEVMREVAEG